MRLCRVTVGGFAQTSGWHQGREPGLTNTHRAFYCNRGPPSDNGCVVESVTSPQSTNKQLRPHRDCTR